MNLYLTVDRDAWQELKREPVFLAIEYDEKAFKLKAYLECLIVLQGFPVVLRHPVMQSRSMSEDEFVDEARKRAKQIVGYEPCLGYFKMKVMGHGR